MNKKILVVAALLMVVCVGGAFAWGIGIQAGGGYPAPGNIAVTFKLDNLPLVFAANAYIGDPFVIGATGDYWFLNNNIAGPLSWYIGAGAGLGFIIGSDTFGVRISGRVPIGLNMWLVDDFIEPYLQIVPGIVININHGNVVDGMFDANLGIRFHF